MMFRSYCCLVKEKWARWNSTCSFCLECSFSHFINILITKRSTRAYVKILVASAWVAQYWYPEVKRDWLIHCLNFESDGAQINLTTTQLRLKELKLTNDWRWDLLTGFSHYLLSVAADCKRFVCWNQLLLGPMFLICKKYVLVGSIQRI